MFSASSSTASLVSNNTVSSRAPLNKPSPAQPKDFQAAFASLQSTYGFAAAAPSPVNKTATPPRSAEPRRASAPSQPKDFEAAFANLQSTYGFAAAAPSPVQKQSSSSSSLFSKLTHTRASSPKAQAASPSAPVYKTKVRQIPRPAQHTVVL